MLLAGIGLAFNILVRKGGKFPNTHVSGNPYLKKKGVYCAQTQDKQEQLNAYKKVNYKDLTFVQESEH